ncbi:uncharacterized protein BDR25DRAFT_359492 [Lindgomyces ingoldianus]|uniref:Uncharacterized protein n=1 Tax=Lindgomyces ingoldianus TaxID=673940 RepID=A0ACB6QKC8_9PLEO|nr:uncharacterized protein BDR25DRAFT_359492 [Lindgomyces ingoldianus]KAF2466596.1 hypothetical protein BDR25DRAFT_359492 [Lindgomyces ingoldianus]
MCHKNSERKRTSKECMVNQEKLLTLTDKATTDCDTRVEYRVLRKMINTDGSIFENRPSTSCPAGPRGIDLGKWIGREPVTTKRHLLVKARLSNSVNVFVSPSILIPASTLIFALLEGSAVCGVVLLDFIMKVVVTHGSHAWLTDGSHQSIQFLMPLWQEKNERPLGCELNSNADVSHSETADSSLRNGNLQRPALGSQQGKLRSPQSRERHRLRGLTAFSFKNITGLCMPQRVFRGFYSFPRQFRSHHSRFRVKTSILPIYTTGHPLNRINLGIERSQSVMKRDMHICFQVFTKDTEKQLGRNLEEEGSDGGKRRKRLESQRRICERLPAQKVRPTALKIPPEIYCTRVMDALALDKQGFGIASPSEA